MLLMLHHCETGLVAALKYLVRSELRHRVLQLAKLGLLPRALSVPLVAAFAQPFEGDITVGEGDIREGAIAVQYCQGVYRYTLKHLG